jgi:hypothetical protein
MEEKFSEKLLTTLQTARDMVLKEPVFMRAKK